MLKSGLERISEDKGETTEKPIDIRTVKQPNPFKVPDTENFFAVKEHMEKLKHDKRISMAGSSLSMRSMLNIRPNFRSMTRINPINGSAEEAALAQLVLSPDSNQKEEGLKDFIQQKREIFLAQLAIDTKREELQRLERLEREEEESINTKKAEIELFKDQFNSFLQNDGKATMEARQAAESKSKQRIEVSMQIKQVSSKISSLRNEIAHHDEKLQECKEYEQFLESLTPPEWRKTHPLPEMYFKDPQQLLDIIMSIEEQNMFLIRHCQEAEEAVERYRLKFNKLLESRDSAITDMNMNMMHKRESLKNTELQNQQYMSFSEFRHGNELSDGELNELQRVISEFHSKLGFDAASSTDTGMMLRRIENKMEEMIKLLRTLNPDQVRALAMEKERKRRNLERTEKQAEQKRIQAEKTLKAITLANKPIKRKTGRPLLERMVPKKGKSRQEEEEKLRRAAAQEAADQQLLYGTIWD